MIAHKDWTLLVWGENIQGHPEDAAHNIVCGPHCALVASIPLGCVASTHDEPGETVITEDEALEHARLIAAAPDLLEALKLAEATLVDDNFGPDYVPLVGEPLHVIRAAIAKATGEDA